MSEPIKIPSNCPSCGSNLVFVQAQLFCKNPKCSAITSKMLLHFVKTLGIKGLGDKTIEKLSICTIPELYKLTLGEITNLIGSEKNAKKIFDNIEHSVNIGLTKLLAAFGIPLIGNSASQKLTKVVNHIDDITLETCKEAGLGDKATSNLLSFLEIDLPLMRDELPFSFSVVESEKPKVTECIGSICITGKLVTYSNKKEAKEVLSSIGYKVTESVTKSTNYLVDESNSSSAKRKKADTEGICIITDLKQFIEKNLYDSNKKVE